MNNSITKEDILFGGVLLHSLLSNEEDYIAHYGRLGMKWYQHIFGEYQGAEKYAKKGATKIKKLDKKISKRMSDYSRQYDKERERISRSSKNYDEFERRETEHEKELDKHLAELDNEYQKKLDLRKKVNEVEKVKNNRLEAEMKRTAAEINNAINRASYSSKYESDAEELFPNKLNKMIDPGYKKGEVSRAYNNAARECSINPNSEAAIRSFNDLGVALVKNRVPRDSDFYSYALISACETGAFLSKSRGITEEIKNLNKEAKVYDSEFFRNGKSGLTMYEANQKVPMSIKDNYYNALKSVMDKVKQTVPIKDDQALIRHVESTYRTAESKFLDGSPFTQTSKAMIVQQVRGLDATEHTNAEIAEILGISPSTVSAALNGKLKD